VEGWRLWSLLIIVGSALLFIALERRFPYDRGQGVLRKDFWLDLIWYGLVQSYLLGFVISWLIGRADAVSGLSRLHLVSGWPVLAQLAFFFVTHDLYIYWFHRWQHHSAVLWRIHEAHHAPVEVDWLSGVRSHPLEILINQTIEFAPLALLGAHPDVVLMKATLDAVWGMYIHSNLGVRTGLFQRVLNGPEMHRWHHSGHVTEGGFNYSTKLAIWDWIFGTAYLPETRPAGYGLSGGVVFPKGYLAQTLFAFRPFKAAAGVAAPASVGERAA
jgi:sterol desaturase/sphingolipid hydroxylase (fatty acid hydroxylase superfamily)